MYSLQRSISVFNSRSSCCSDSICVGTQSMLKPVHTTQNAIKLLCILAGRSATDNRLLQHKLLCHLSGEGLYIATQQRPRCHPPLAVLGADATNVESASRAYGLNLSAHDRPVEKCVRLLEFGSWKFSDVGRPKLVKIFRNGESCCRQKDDIVRICELLPRYARLAHGS